MLCCLTTSQATADGWEPVAAATQWNGGDRFSTASLTPAASSSKRTAFVRDLDGLNAAPIDQLLALIHRAESPRLGYDSVHGKAHTKPPSKPSEMTIGGIFDWIEKTPDQPHAIGRYQVIPKTLARVTRALGLKRSTRFDKRTQDLIGRHLVAEAGYSEFINGRMTREEFMHNLAKVWAGLPTANGRSYYHGYAGNKATISRASYERAMVRIFPHRVAAK